MVTRIITGAELIVLLVTALVLGGWVFSCLWIATLCIAMYEIYHALSKAGHRPVAWPVWVCLVVSIPTFLLMKETMSLYLMVTSFCIACVAVAAIVMFRSNPRLEDMLLSLMPLIYILIPGLSMLGLLRVTPEDKQRILMAAVFFIPAIGDAGAYFIGMKYGKTKLNPVVSPKKTVEGAIGGLLCSVMAALATYAIGGAFAVQSSMPPLWHFALLGLFGGAVGQIGDLFASLIKRHCGIKDFGHIFPGHGGMLDRLDSILFVTVLVYLYQVVW